MVTAFQIQYRQEFIKAFEQHQSLLRETVTTVAVIKGKKYKGAIVVEPKPGVHFNVTGLDFASSSRRLRRGRP